MPPPFRPRTYSDYPLNPVHCHEPQQPLTFVEYTQAQIDADVRGVTRAMLLGAIAGVIAAALIWWAQS